MCCANNCDSAADPGVAEAAAAVQTTLDNLAQQNSLPVDYSIDGQSVSRMGAANAAVDRAVKLRTLQIALAGPVAVTTYARC